MESEKTHSNQSQNHPPLTLPVKLLIGCCGLLPGKHYNGSLCRHSQEVQQSAKIKQESGMLDIPDQHLVVGRCEEQVARWRYST